MYAAAATHHASVMRTGRELRSTLHTHAGSRMRPGEYKRAPVRYTVGYTCHPCDIRDIELCPRLVGQSTKQN